VIRRQIDRFLREHEAAVDVVLEFDNIENIKQAVALGAGVALLPEPTLRREIRAGTLVGVRLEDHSLTRAVGIIHRRRHKLSAAAQCFLNLLRAESNGNGHAAAHGEPSARAPNASPRTAERSRNGTHRARRTV
jgi:DNA-binding transcriptional LysR family regulator